ncbi:hypothetical protein B0H14DRAFT_2638347 [Mycena olivaceomarginata]|nr:hypothetical protein B0H14DRAFT_2638347 [Mycena olivaceomarginata]
MWTLARWEAPCCKKALENMQEAAYTMYTAFDEDTIEPWRPEYPDDHNTQISSNCRYFTVGRNIPSEARTKFHPKTDPQRYVEKDPGTFKTGNIVEMGFALVAWKKQGKMLGQIGVVCSCSEH